MLPAVTHPCLFRSKLPLSHLPAESTPVERTLLGILPGARPECATWRGVSSNAQKTTFLALSCSPRPVFSSTGKKRKTYTFGTEILESLGCWNTIYPDYLIWPLFLDDGSLSISALKSWDSVLFEKTLMWGLRTYGKCLSCILSFSVNLKLL